ncbi:type II secretion system F family protein [Paraburkholderia rhizosphaerae]|uniref:Type IV pilus assembly protein PilC n=1 Tax=Paraburkholderia rhizosphaerae TaxID=480658 RepID=A0A4R8LRL1_9BURK|nr:type II secretion system F family protein [Paraburkholderia rhizosphaerae]TDY50249.1 type IV pilus assembly protein PilC [Paraburkholderia rhizosphaerae]
MRNDVLESLSEELRFRWRGVEADGTHRSGHVIATDVAAARAKLRRDGLFIVELTALGPAPRAHASPADITRFTRQLASLLRAGLPLAPSLELLANAPASTKKSVGMSRIVGALARNIVTGSSFSQALRSRSDQFGPLYWQLVAVGEASGALANVLERIADDRERAAAQRAKVRAALTYPAAILALAIVITAALLIWVVPTFRQIFDGFGAALPAPTQAVLALSAALTKWSLPIGVFGIAAGVSVAKLLLISDTARLWCARMTLRAPITGPLLTMLCAARWSRALGTLLSAGTPLADAFVSLDDATGNAYFDRATSGIAARIKNGERLAAAMQATRCFPAEVVQPVAVAEEAGTLDKMLMDVASLCDRQVAEKTGALASLCEPMVIAVLGLLVGGLVIAMYLPIIQLGNVV